MAGKRQSAITANRFCGESGRIERLQRYPQYSDTQLKPWLNQVEAGYSFKQAAELVGLDWKTVENTFYSDDEVFDYALTLSMVAGEQIRRGEKPVPDRDDGLYEEQ